MTGEDRYHQAELKARLIGQRELRQFVSGEIEVLPCWGDRIREFIITEMDAMQNEIDRQRDILKAAGLDGAMGEAVRLSVQRSTALTLEL